VLTPKGNPIVLKALTNLPVNQPIYAPWFDFVDKVNKQSNGELKIEVVGGPEVIPTFEQMTGLRKGAIDMLQAMGSNYASVLPEANCLHLSRITPWEERANGTYDYLVELHKKVNVMYLGRTNYPAGFRIYTNVRVERPHDLANLKVRTGATYIAFLKALGMHPVMIPPADLYTALERGLVDSYAWEIGGIVDWGWSEVTKYLIEPKFFEANNMTVQVNLDKWNRLPAHLQKLLKDLVAETERAWVPWCQKYEQTEKQKMLNAKMKVIEFSQTDGKWYYDLAYKAMWEDTIQKLPDAGPKLRKLMTP
jgi:TRAP-type C4-dicarboxylate transport system substrate-binding protein